MEKKEILFQTNWYGKKETILIDVPVQNNSVITSKFCPPDFLTGGVSNLEAINGESLTEFTSDCNLQLRAMQSIHKGYSKLDRHLGGLMAAVASHLNRYGRLIFGDLLIYMDCFSLLLAADGFTEKEIRHLYPRVTKSIVDLYPEQVKDSVNLGPIHQSLLYPIINQLAS